MLLKGAAYACFEYGPCDAPGRFRDGDYVGGVLSLASISPAGMGRKLAAKVGAQAIKRFFLRRPVADGATEQSPQGELPDFPTMRFGLQTTAYNMFSTVTSGLGARLCRGAPSLMVRISRP
jgi:hypothetical protein